MAHKAAQKSNPKDARDRAGSAARGAPPQLSTGYLESTRRPLTALVFLLPLIVLYEIGLMLYAGDYDIVARQDLSIFFSALGVTGAHLPGLIIVSVLLCWHIAGKYPWRLDGRLLVPMFVESCLWAVPLMLMMILLARHIPTAAAAASPSSDIHSHPWQSQLVFSIGAGIYEELLFRLMGLALLHLFLVDLLKMPERMGAVIAVLVTSALFAWYHFPTLRSIEPGRFISYTVAGIYFALVYLGRGFGVAVGVHAMYDVYVVALRAFDHHQAGN